MDNIIINLDSVSKFYKLYTNPKNRLKEALHPLGKIYHKKFFALNNIDLQISRGDILGVVGRNGSGKSTLLKLICGVLQPSGGRIDVRGRITALLELGAGFNPNFTGRENIYFYSVILGIEKKKIKERIDLIIEFAELGDFIDQPLKTYSSGMKSRLGFSVAAHVDPEILILDEVLAVGDTMFKRKCFRKMDEFFNSGKTVLFVSHNEHSIIQNCSRAIIIENHSIYADGKPDEIISMYRQLTHSGKNSTPKSSSIFRDGYKNLETISQENFKSDLKVEPVSINGHLAEVLNIRIVNRRGEIVNLLEQGGSYSLRFEYHMYKDFNGVSIGVQIRTLDSFLISGANLRDYHDKVLDSVAGGSVVDVEWTFKCHLVPGDYCVYIYFTAEDSQDTSIVEDAAIFKVNRVAAQNGGVVNLEQVIKYKVR